MAEPSVAFGAEQPREGAPRRLALGLASRVPVAVMWLGLITFVGLPIYTVLVRSVQTEDGSLGLEAAIRLLHDPSIGGIIGRTVYFAAGSLAIAMVLSLALAVAATRMRLPLPEGMLRILPIVSLFVAPLLGALGWVFLFAPRAGLVNIFARYLFDTGPDFVLFNAYSLPSLFLASGIYVIPFVYLVLVAGLSNMDGSLEEASRMCGAGGAMTLWRITLPLMLPTIASAALLGFVITMSEFTLPLVLGNAFGFDVISIDIYRRVKQTFPADYGGAAVLGILLLGVTLFFTWGQGWLLSRSRAKFWVVGGKGGRLSKNDIGIWRWLVAAFVVLYFILSTLAPVAALAYTALQPFWGRVSAKTLSLVNYTTVLENRQGELSAIWNSTILGSAGATLGVFVGFGIAYVFVRTKLPGRRVIEGLAAAPGAMPNMLLGFGFLLLYLQLKAFPLYGTLLGLLIAYVIIYLTHSTRTIAGVLHQIDPSLEEAASICGASRWRSFFGIVLPLSAAGLWAAWTLLFALMFREVSATVIMGSSQISTVSLKLLELYDAGAVYPVVAALGCVVLAVNVGIVCVGQYLAHKSQWRR